MKNRSISPSEPWTDDDGVVRWIRESDGKIHRDDGPAIEYPDGSRRWLRNGKLHRTDGPAIENAEGSRHWFRNDLLYRKDGPAIEHEDGTREWFIKNQRHREDGPAVENADGTVEWWLHNQEMEFEEWCKHTALGEDRISQLKLKYGV